LAELAGGGSTAQLARFKQRGGLLGKLAAEFQAGQKDVAGAAQAAKALAVRASAHANAARKRRRRAAKDANAAVAPADTQSAEEVVAAGDGVGSGGKFDGAQAEEEDAAAFWARMEAEEGGNGAAPAQQAASIAVTHLSVGVRGLSREIRVVYLISHLSCVCRAKGPTRERESGAGGRRGCRCGRRSRASRGGLFV
jgi:hypothetical protein